MCIFVCLYVGMCKHVVYGSPCVCMHVCMWVNLCVSGGVTCWVTCSELKVFLEREISILKPSLPWVHWNRCGKPKEEGWAAPLRGQ